MKTTIKIQYRKQVNADEIEKRVKEHLKESGQKLGEIEELDIYYKPAEGAVYYVAIDKNGQITGSNNTPLII